MRIRILCRKVHAQRDCAYCISVWLCCQWVVCHADPTKAQHILWRKASNQWCWSRHGHCHRISSQLRMLRITSSLQTVPWCICVASSFWSPYLSFLRLLFLLKLNSDESSSYSSLICPSLTWSWDPLSELNVYRTSHNAWFQRLSKQVFCSGCSCGNYPFISQLHRC